MKYFDFVTLFIALTAGAAFGVESRPNDALLTAARKALPEEIAMNEMVKGFQAGLWNSNRTAVAVAFAKPKASLILIFLRQTDGAYIAADASGVEEGNLGKLGIAGRSGYDRLETKPLRWVSRDDGLLQVIMRTRAWRGGQRHTVSEPLLIKPDGTVLWR
jgi:hypothetical protein